MYCNSTLVIEGPKVNKWVSRTNRRAASGRPFCFALELSAPIFASGGLARTIAGTNQDTVPEWWGCPMPCASHGRDGGISLIGDKFRCVMMIVLPPSNLVITLAKEDVHHEQSLLGCNLSFDFRS